MLVPIYTASVVESITNEKLCVFFILKKKSVLKKSVIHNEPTETFKIKKIIFIIYLAISVFVNLISSYRND